MPSDDNPAADRPPAFLGHYMRRYVEGDPAEFHDGHTGMIRSAFDIARRRQRLKFLVILAVVSIVLVGVAVIDSLDRSAQLAMPPEPLSVR